MESLEEGKGVAGQSAQATEKSWEECKEKPNQKVNFCQ